MPHDLPKAYDPTTIEDKWAEYWVSENLFAQPAPAEGSTTESRLDGQSSFTVLLPPPNVTGQLHMGHMFEQAEIDILTRWHRMRGDRALWVPGTDHAGIATQMMVEKQVAAEGTTRQQLGREAFLARVWQWKQLYGGAILEQMKRLGASVDWQREYFTMDANLSVAVREAFTRLYAQGLIYRGAYIVNWCPGCQTAISDLEVVHEETAGKLWEIRYPVAGADGEFSSGVPDDGSSSLGWLTIATTRPETMLGDTAVAVHPEDERYLHLHGKKLLLPLGDGAVREIPIVLDAWVSRDFGTGAVKVTPAHDPNDFALGQRHHLPSINVMDDQARITIDGPYKGLDRYVARKRILTDLEAAGLLGTVHEHKLSIGRCDRSKDVVEPRLSEQWFVAVNKEPGDGRLSMAATATAAVKQGHIPITPPMYEKTYLNWMENIHDWCISRQLWWGHRIPAWHCGACHKITVPQPGEAQDPAACVHCGSLQLTQETDVLDTWFSSGLLPVSVFGWPFLDADGKASVDFATFYSTNLLVTGFDILFFWVARMIMLGCWFAGDVPEADGSQRTLARSVPFQEVYIHALIRDAHGDKMSKTKGNVVDPIEIVKQYGTDAVRFTLASMASPGTDIAFNLARTEGYRAFANKIWNAARFIFMNVDRAAEVGIVVAPNAFGAMPAVGEDAPLEARWIIDELELVVADVNASLENYRFDEAANFLYQFFWGSFCDLYIESVKLRLDFSESADRGKTQAALITLISVFEVSLRLLSPFMPFITEEIWHALHGENLPARSIALTAFPMVQIDRLARANRGTSDPGVQMYNLQRLKSEVLSQRKDLGVEEKEIIAIVLRCDPFLKWVIDENADLFRRLAKVSHIDYEQNTGSLHPELTRRIGTNFEFAVIYEKEIDVVAERERLAKDIAKFEKQLIANERQLGNEGFLAKAPAAIVQGLKKQDAEARLLLEKARAALAALPLE